MELTPITCPSCFEVFEVPAPGAGELPAEWDYDCEICCRPMLIIFSESCGEIFAEARSLDD